MWADTNILVRLVTQHPAAQFQAVQTYLQTVNTAVKIHPAHICEALYVLEGQVEVTIDGKPAVVVRPGETFFIPAGAVHEGKNAGSTVAKILGTYVVEKGKPLSTPAK